MSKLWNIISESKQGKKYINSIDQYNNLDKIFSKLTKEEIELINNEWCDKSIELTKDENEYMELHISKGGIVNGGDDTFFMDFGNWIIAQGEELFNDFQQNGHKVIINYINNYNIPESDYTFECMRYVFHNYL